MRGAALASLAVLATAGCERGAVPRTAPAPHTVRYRLEWLTDGIVKDPDGNGWSVRSHLGYQVRVISGWLTSYSMELVECPRSALAEPIDLLSSLSAAPAFAGHSAGTPNPAAVRPMQVESLTDPVPHDVGTVTLAPQPYCKLHYLLARAGHDSPGLPSEIDMVDTTLHLEVAYKMPDTGEEIALTIHTATAYGQLFEHAAESAAPLDVDPGRGDVQVVLRRKLGSMFDGVDFVQATSKLVPQRVLQSIVDSTEIVIVSGADAKR